MEFGNHPPNWCGKKQQQKIHCSSYELSDCQMWKPQHINTISAWRSVRVGHGHSSHARGYHRSSRCPGAQSEEAMRTCTSNYHSCMPGIQIPRAQPGICEEAFAVTARLAEPPCRSNICQGKAFPASWLPDASEGPQLSRPKPSSVNITESMFDFTGNSMGKGGISCSELAMYLKTVARIQVT